LAMAQRWGLELRTPWGTVTRRGNRTRNEADSTIDLAWASPQLDTEYLGSEDLAGSDHIPQLLVAHSLNAQRTSVRPEGWSWMLADRQRIEWEAAELKPPSNITTVEQLEAVTEDLVRELHRIADVAVPRRKLAEGQAAGWWNAEVKDAVGKARRALRNYRTTPSQLTYDELKEAQQD
jgi:hypothetical protein